MQPASNSGSTLELVVNEQQMQNMSQIDVSYHASKPASQPASQLVGCKFPSLFLGLPGPTLSRRPKWAWPPELRSANRSPGRYSISTAQPLKLRPSPAEGNEQTTAKLNHYLAQAAAGQQQQRQQQQQRGQASMFSLEELRSWPARLRENFHSKLDSAKAKSETRTEYAIEIVRTFSGIVVWVLCFLCTIVLPIILLLIGLVNLDDCSDRPCELAH